MTLIQMINSFSDEQVEDNSTYSCFYFWVGLLIVNKQLVINWKLFVIK